MAKKITRADVAQAAAESGIMVLAALNMMQSAAAKMGDERTLEQLIAVKNEILFGDE